MNVGMLACYNQVKEVVVKMLGEPMANGPALTMQVGVLCMAVSIHGISHACHFLSCAI